MKYIKSFKEISINDLPLVGGKNASLGEMINALSNKIEIPNGFAVTVDGYWHYLKENNLIEQISSELKIVNLQNLESLQNTSKKIRKIIESATIPSDLEKEIIDSYKILCPENCSVAVRSSATAEDLPNASFAGQQETFLNITTEKDLLICYKKCISSLFTARAITYRKEHSFDDLKVGLSVGIQKMIPAESAGVSFTLDTDTGFKGVVLINSSWGLGESVVKGSVTPDSFYVHKETLKKDFKPILKKTIGNKNTKIIYSKNNTKTANTAKDELENFSINDNDILQITRMSLNIEDYYSQKNNAWTPMDIEWVKSLNDQKIYIVQARPETIHALHEKNLIEKYVLSPKEKLNVLTQGQSIGQKISSGKAKVIRSLKDISKVEEGDIIITSMTDPDWVPAMKKSSGIITDQGGRTCHTAIVSRELGIPAIVGTSNGTNTISNNSEITIDCSSGEKGFVYEGKIDFYIEKIEVNTDVKLPTQLYVNIGDPEQAFSVAQLPSNGVGLARLEFIIANNVKIHPMALVHPEKIEDKNTKLEIEKIIKPYNKNYKDYFIDKLAQEAGTIAAAFYPKPVIIRMSDFKSNEYRNLIGGKYFEPEEENPMIGLRGASRYYSPLYKEAFELECKAIKKIREEMGFENVQVMIPFVRTPEEAAVVTNIMKNLGLERNKNNLKIIMMCEVPSNVILMDEFSNYFDGFSIGSNDLTQLTLGIDRDSKYLAHLFDERNNAIIAMLTLAIEGAHRNNKTIGICGQAPSDYPEIAQFLIDLKIDSISLNPDTILQFIKRFNNEQN